YPFRRSVDTVLVDFPGVRRRDRPLNPLIRVNLERTGRIWVYVNRSRRDAKRSIWQIALLFPSKVIKLFAIPQSSRFNSRHYAWANGLSRKKLRAIDRPLRTTDVDCAERASTR